MNENENDLLDSLLESLSDDQEMEKKIDAFARNKERSLRIQRARQTSEQFQQTYSRTARRKAAKQSAAQAPLPAKEDDVDLPPFMDEASHQTITIPVKEMKKETPASDEAGLTRKMPVGGVSEEEAGGGTRVFDSADNASAADGTEGSTVSMDDHEIQSLLDSDQPILTREYLAKDEGDEEEDIPAYRRSQSAPRKKNNPQSWRKFALIAAIIAVIGLIGGGGWMIYSTIQNSGLTQSTSASFDKLLSWAQNFSSLSEDEQKQITSFRSIYDKLGEDEKRKINEALMASTGKTFDELLAAAEEQDKPDASNANIANAEKKAELKEQIDDLQSQINALQSQLDSTSQRVSSAENDYNTKNAALQAANDALAAAQANVSSLQSQLDALPSESSLQSQISSLQSQLDALNRQPSNPGKDDDDDDDDKPSSQVPDNSAQKAQLQSQIDDLKSQLSSNSSQRSSLQQQLNDANKAVSDAQAAQVSAQSAADTAYGAWQAVITDTSPIQQQINNLAAQQAALQSQYDSID